jgi:hypothetical protein
MAQLQQIQKQHANQQHRQFQLQRERSKPLPPPPMSLGPLPSSCSSSSSSGGGSAFCDRPTPTKAQLTMPPRLNHHKPPQGMLGPSPFGSLAAHLGPPGCQLPVRLAISPVFPPQIT